MSTSLEKRLAEAREAYATDPDRSLEIRRQIAASEISPTWSNANMDLASYEVGTAEYQQAANRCEAVLRAPADDVDPAARAIAGVLLCEAREALEQPVDETLLLQSVEACATQNVPMYAAAGLSQFSRFQVMRGERAEAKATLLRAISFYDQTPSWFATPGVLIRLAKLEIEDGNKDKAREYIDRGFAILEKLPYPGTSGTVLRKKLTALRDSMP